MARTYTTFDSSTRSFRSSSRPSSPMLWDNNNDQEEPSSFMRQVEQDCPIEDYFPPGEEQEVKRAQVELLGPNYANIAYKNLSSSEKVRVSMKHLENWMAKEDQYRERVNDTLDELHESPLFNNNNGKMDQDSEADFNNVGPSPPKRPKFPTPDEHSEKMLENEIYELDKPLLGREMQSRMEVDIVGNWNPSEGRLTDSQFLKLCFPQVGDVEEAMDMASCWG